MYYYKIHEINSYIDIIALYLSIDLDAFYGHFEAAFVMPDFSPTTRHTTVVKEGL